MAQQRINIGNIAGAFGVKGWVKVFSDTRPSENILAYSPWRLAKNNSCTTVTVINGHLQGKAIVAQLAEIKDREQAKLLTDWGISIAREQLPKTNVDEFYWSDLIGLTVITVGGHNLGQVDHLIETGANDVLVIKGGRERLIPFLVGKTVLKIDQKTRKMLVDWNSEF